MSYIEQRKERFQGLLRQLTDEQLYRLVDTEPHEYEWNWFDYHGDRSMRCVAGHVFDLEVGSRSLGDLADEDRHLAYKLSRESEHLPFEAISSLTEEEVMRRAMEQSDEVLDSLTLPASKGRKIHVST